MALTNDQVDALQDEQFSRECGEVDPLDCDGYGDDSDICAKCPAWDALRARVAARLTAGEAPAVLTRRSEDAP